MVFHSLRDGQGHQFSIGSCWAACEAGQRKAGRGFASRHALVRILVGQTLWVAVGHAGVPHDRASLLRRASWPPVPGPGHQLHWTSRLR